MSVYAGRFERGDLVCPLCGRQLLHTHAEHVALVRVIRHPLQPEVWGDDDLQVVSRGHHPPERFLAAIAVDAEVAWALDLLDADADDLRVRHVYLRYRPRSRYEDSEWHGAWWQADRGRGAVPFTIAELAS